MVSSPPPNLRLWSKRYRASPVDKGFSIGFAWRPPACRDRPLQIMGFLAAISNDESVQSVKPEEAQSSWAEETTSSAHLIRAQNGVW